MQPSGLRGLGGAFLPGSGLRPSRRRWSESARRRLISAGSTHGRRFVMLLMPVPSMGFLTAFLIFFQNLVAFFFLISPPAGRYVYTPWPCRYPSTNSPAHSSPLSNRYVPLPW